MKAGNCWRWRPAMGVLVAGALAFAVSVQGGPRVTDGKTAPNKGRAKSDTARLVTGPSENLNAVIAGTGATAILELVPVVNNGDGNPFSHGGAYDASNISGNTLTVAGGGFTMFWAVKASNWDPARDGEPLVRSTSARIDAKQFAGVNAVPSNPGCDITRPPAVACAAPSPAACIAAFNTVGAPACGDGFPDECNHAWFNKTKDSESFGDGSKWIHWNSWGDVIADVGLGGPTGPILFTTALPTEGAADDGTDFFVGYIAWSLPSCAAGTYTLGYLAGETFLSDPANVKFDLGEVRPAVITIPVGKCCHNIGQGSAGCKNALSEGACTGDAGHGLAVWNEGQTCDNAPTDDGCCECAGPTADAACDNGDQCYDHSCTNCVCFHNVIAEWDAGECCDAGSGDTCTPTPANTCQTAACELAGDRGICVNSSIAAGDPCTGDGDDNPCTAFDVCDASEGCAGVDVNGMAIPCVDNAECAAATGGLTAPTCVSGTCDCSLTPDLTIYKVESDNKDGHCYDGGENGDKVTALVNVAAATAAINGGQFLIEYDPTCLDYNSSAGVAPYTDAVYGPIVDEAAGTIFIVVGVGFGGVDGPAGNADMLSLSFTKIGVCDSCQICFGNNNPANTYLADNMGQRIDVNPVCSKAIMADGDVEVDVPVSMRNLNIDCDQPTKIVTWDAPTASDTCGESTIHCWGEHESGALYGEGMAMGGGELPIGISNFCCYAESDWCGDWDGCAPGADCPAVPAEKEGFFDVDGCWTVDISDETSLDVELQLSPTADAKPGDGVERCIKFTLYPNTIQEPVRITAPVVFGNSLDHVGKVKDKIKLPGNKQWDCISAWDQYHTLRACYLFGPDDCLDGQLRATFTGDPLFGGNWLIGGNLDGWKKNVDGSNPSLFTIDVLDYATFTAAFGDVYTSGSTPCGTPGPHADIDGDGDVDMDDYTFIHMNFLTTAKMCCGVDGLPAATPITSITVRELREMGRGELAVADLNGDGVVDMVDMQAFSQGVRPVTKGSRIGTR